MQKKALAYTSDIILERTGEVINRAHQKALISQYAEENGIEVVGWFEDEAGEEDILARPGIQKMLGYEKPYDIFLVERVWALSREMDILSGFLKVLGQKKVILGAVTYLWDATSQIVRNQLAGKAIAPARLVETVARAQAPRKVAVLRPEKFHFDWAFDGKVAK
jgi:DNA invertase Pin-like site-specific DNA recombinase